MICLTVNLRGLPMWTLPEAQTLLKEPYGPEGRRAATGAAISVWQSDRHRHNRNGRRSIAPRLRCRDIHSPRPGPTMSICCVVIVHPTRGYRLLAGCLDKRWGGESGAICHWHSKVAGLGRVDGFNQHQSARKTDDG